MPKQPGDSRSLGLPAEGSGAAGGIGRRVAALCVDWFACLAIAAFVNGAAQGRFDLATLTLIIFFIQVTLLTWLTGASFGQRFLGLIVAPVGRSRVGLPAVTLRTLLICLVIPAVVIGDNGRGLHDIAAGTVVIRR